MQLDILNLNGQKQGTVELSADIFGQSLRADLLQRAVNFQLAGARSGLANTKTRGEIDRSKAKWFRQKGTGRARHGARSPSLFVGGGVVFGPRPRDFAHSLTKKVKQLALKVALSSKANAQQLIIIDEAKLGTHKTKDLVEKLAKLNITSAAFIVDALDSNFDKASRNVPHLKVLPTEGANVYDILRYKTLVLTANAVKMLEGRLSADAKEAAPKAAKAPAKKAAPKAEKETQPAKKAAPKAAAKAKKE